MMYKPILYRYIIFTPLSHTLQRVDDPISFGFIGRPFIISTIYTYIYDDEDNNTSIEYPYNAI